MISQEEAIKIAEKHHGPGFKLNGITHGIPGNGRIYGAAILAPDDVWCILCSAHPNDDRRLESSRAIVVHKDTGDVLYDGSANDEG